MPVFAKVYMHSQRLVPYHNAHDDLYNNNTDNSNAEGHQHWFAWNRIVRAKETNKGRKCDNGANANQTCAVPMEKQVSIILLLLLYIKHDTYLIRYLLTVLQYVGHTCW